MRENVFRFYRGTCHLFYEDLCKQLPDDGLRTWICGDLHLENFGAYKGDDREVYFDMNDFDEAILAHPAWELARTLVSIHVAAGVMQFSKADARKMCVSFLEEYAKVLSSGKIKWVNENNTKGLVNQFLRKLEQRKRKDFLSERTVHAAAGLRFRMDRQRYLPLNRAQKIKLIRFFEKWKERSSLKKIYKVQDIAIRLAGTGSIGLERYALLVNAKKAPHRHYLIEMKEARPSSLAPYVKIKQPQWKNEAERVVAIQHRMQGVSPAMLTWMNYKGKKFVIKELQPAQDKMDLRLCKGKFKKLDEIVRVLAQVTASAQLRSGGRDGSSISDELIAFGKDKKWRKPLLDLCAKYEAKVNSDYREYCRELDSFSLKK
jgi:uncharacterized protein (DUF2252 family)